MEFRVLEGVPPEDARRFLAMARRRTFEREQIVFHQGDVADALHLITKGRFALRVVSPLGQSAMLAVREPGETFGEFALLETDARRTVTVAALEPGETLSIGGDAFRALLDDYPELKDVLVALLAERLRYSDELILAAPTPASAGRCSGSSRCTATATTSSFRSRRRPSPSSPVPRGALSTACYARSRSAGPSRWSAGACGCATETR